MDNRITLSAGLVDLARRGGTTDRQGRPMLVLWPDGELHPARPAFIDHLRALANQAALAAASVAGS
jgi:hypothetical protein